MTKLLQLAEKIAGYVPEGTAPVLAKWIVDHCIQVAILPERKSKYGDYRPPQRGSGHKITINGTLNPYNFLITFTHEVAHLVTWKKYQNQVAPHGPEWKKSFRELLMPFVKNQVFPPEVAKVLAEHLKNPAASSCRDPDLVRVLDKYNHKDQHLVFLDELPIGQYFLTSDKRLFKKQEKLRKNYSCVEVNTKRNYRVSGLLKVTPVDLPPKQ